ncbi:MAG: ATP-grasp domain-containing protein, partial [Bryobacteraceae bacterium]
MPRLLLFAATTGYQIRVFAEAARRLGVDLTLATDRCHVLEDPWGDRAIPVRFGNVPGALAACLDAIGDRRFDAVAAVGDAPAVLAADVAGAFDIPFHPPAAVRACHDKYLARQLFQAAGLRVPQFFRVALTENPDAIARRAPYPCVLKPLGLSASRGVIRANHPDEFRAAFARIKALLERTPDIRMAGENQSHYVQVEAYIPGREFAVEGILTRGAPRILAIFDKPDALEGPFFEETIYVTPSRESAAAQR